MYANYLLVALSSFSITCNDMLKISILITLTIGVQWTPYPEMTVLLGYLENKCTVCPIREFQWSLAYKLLYESMSRYN